MPNDRLEPNRDDLERFVDTAFRYADEGTKVVMRTFAEGSDEVLETVRVTLRDDGLTAITDAAVRQASKAANRSSPAVFAPPVATFLGNRTRERDLANGLVIAVEADQNPFIALRNLQSVIGFSTISVASGGNWSDPNTGEVHEKRHAYWRCVEPSRSAAEHNRLKHARWLACRFVGADRTAITNVHPMRWPGSWHRKAEPRLARIVDCRAAMEIDPEEVIDLLDPLVPRSGSGRTRSSGASPCELSAEDLSALGEIIANNDRDWADWNRLGMAFFAASGGDDAGFEAFDTVSRKSAKHVQTVTRDRWEHYRTSPPDRLGPGTLIFEARQVEPSFRLASHRKRRSSQRDDSSGTNDAKAKNDSVNADGLPPNTEDSLALQFTARHADDWRHVSAWGSWMVWTGAQWQREKTLKAFDLARQICRDAAISCDSPKIAAKISSAATVAAVERLARADRRHAAKTDDWDQDLWALNTPAGIVDLRTGDLTAHVRARYMTKMAAAIPGVGCPTWEQFLAKVTGDDEELQAYLARMVGYVLTGIISEHALFFFYGTGANGKSVFTNTISAILGEYATSAPMETFMASHSDRHPTDLAGLRGARLVTSVETEQGRRWAESRIKSMTGGDKVPARFMRQDFFEFTPQFKLVIAGNHKPSIRTVDEAMRRRLHLIPFTVTIPQKERDQALPEKLLAERDGILAWAIRGCLEWQRIGLQPPSSIKAATEEYFEAEDAIGRWLEECCLVGPNQTALSAILFTSWTVWAESNGEFVGTKKHLTELLSARGFESWRDARGGRGLKGLSVRPRDQGGGEV